MTHSLPKYYQSKTVGQLVAPQLAAASQAGSQAQLAPAHQDQTRVALLIIDAQVDFIHPAPVGTLAVPGAVEDTRRTVEFIYRNLASLTTLIASLDSHLAYQIFYPTWWSDAQGNHPAPFTLITPLDISAGKYQPVLEPGWSISYVESLAKDAKKALCIWPFHTMIGSVGQALEPSLSEAIMFHAAARKAQPIYLAKGAIPHTEHYSVLEPEVKVARHPQGGLNTALLNTLADHDLVYVCGQAKSHCVLETLRSIFDYFKNDPQTLGKIRILSDCMSSVAHPDIDFDGIANKAFADFAAKGAKLVTSLDAIG